jgi:hypothetical protein
MSFSYAKAAKRALKESTPSDHSGEASHSARLHNNTALEPNIHTAQAQLPSTAGSTTAPPCRPTRWGTPRPMVHSQEPLYPGNGEEFPPLPSSSAVAHTNPHVHQPCHDDLDEARSTSLGLRPRVIPPLLARTQLNPSIGPFVPQASRGGSSQQHKSPSVYPMISGPSSTLISAPTVFSTTAVHNPYTAPNGPPPPPMGSSVSRLGGDISNSRSLQDVHRYFSRLNDTDVFRYLLGFPFPAAPILAKSAIGIVVDLEEFSHNHKVTEFGAVVIDRQQMPPFTNHITPHAEAHIQLMRYHHLRIKENAHFLNRSFTKADPTSYGFGESRFVSQVVLMDIIHNMFHQLIDVRQPELGYRPVVLIGHALSNDIKLMERGLEWSRPITLVRNVDTQVMAQQAGISTDRQPNLKSMVLALGMQLNNGHTGGNDAALESIAATLMALRYQLYGSTGRFRNGPIPSQTVVDRVRRSRYQYSQSIPPAERFGVKHHCIKCGAGDHSKWMITKFRHPAEEFFGLRQPMCSAKVWCASCGNSPLPNRQNVKGTHTTELCSWVDEPHRH